VGGARSALYNWLLARRLGGTFILRIEDTDTERNRPEWVDGITAALTWLGLSWDELYHQSERFDLYRAAADRLVAGGHAYYCGCSPADVQERTKGNATPGYDSFCRDRGLGAGLLRFRTPREGATVVHDLVRGEPSFEHSTIEDFALVRSNGTPLFILANVVDDIDMGITHVIRGEEHLPNTPKYLLLWRALAADVAEPVFAHLPLLVNAQRKKLSKRRPEDRVELELYQEGGYLPEAMVNFLALLGWAPSDGREFLSLPELVEEFRLEDVNSSAAFFDQKKLLHFNQQYIAALPVAEFVERSLPFLSRAGIPYDAAVFDVMAPLVQERAKTLADVPGMVAFLFADAVSFDEAVWDKRVVRGPSSASLLEEVAAALESCAWDAETLREVVVSVGEKHGLGLGKAQFPVRVAVTGTDVGPPLFESLVVLGRERSLGRLRDASARLAGLQQG
jgi:glutamyl-tRNA synthetase